MKFKSQVYTEVSGSIGGITYAMNQGGMYARARSIPVNPGTVYQQAVRAAMAQLTARWYDTVTASQRAAWLTYAEFVYLPDPFGDPRQIPAIAHYVRSNVPRIQTAQPIVDDAPVVYNLGEYTAPAIASITGSTDILSLTFDNTDAWANEDDSAMLVYISRPTNASIEYFKGPYRFAEAIEGDGITPPTSPAAIPTPFDYTADQKGFIRVVVTRADGRLSATFRGSLVAV